MLRYFCIHTCILLTMYVLHTIRYGIVCYAIYDDCLVRADVGTQIDSYGLYFTCGVKRKRL